MSRFAAWKWSPEQPFSNRASPPGRLVPYVAYVTTASSGQTLRLRDGRRLGYAEYGDPRGEPGFYFHGHPGSRLEGGFADEAATDAGLRIIALDRPGYGLSDFQPGRTILAWPRDVVEVADALGIKRFSVLGSSGGGPYALACAHELPERVTRAGIVSGVGPYEAPGATEGMRWQNRVGFQLGARFPPLARLIMWSMNRQMRRFPERTLDAVAEAMSPVDAEIARRPEAREILGAVIAEAFRQGSRGAALDVVLLGRPWGFRLDEITHIVFLWCGEADVLAPPAMARHLVTKIPNCHATFFPKDGHLLFDHMREIAQAFAT
jgi:pimeloyl-ACP methyl ester carboxylesterase